jgi:tripartite-type tricarboxylate transporter receptor subunit TctC
MNLAIIRATVWRDAFMCKLHFAGQSLLALAALFALSSTGRADSVSDFYKNRSVSLVIGYSVGGGYDAYARLLARYIGKHIPGEPSIVPQQMTGAGSLRAANYIFSVAPKDGSVIGTFSRSMGIAPLLGQADFDSRKFTWLGSVTDDDTTCVTWNTSPIKTWDDFLSKPFKLGGLGADSDPDIWALLYKNVFGAKVQLVTGYPGTNDVVLAMERGEVDGLCGLSWSTIRTRHAEWLSSQSVNIIVQAALKKEPEIASVPLATDLAATPEQHQIIRLLLASQAMARPFVAPPEIPEDRKAALIAAFDATMTDPDFLAEAQKLSFEIHPVSAATIDALLAEVYITPKDVLGRATKAISSANQ